MGFIYFSGLPDKSNTPGKIGISINKKLPLNDFTERSEKSKQILFTHASWKIGHVEIGIFYIIGWGTGERHFYPFIFYMSSIHFRSGTNPVLLSDKIYKSKAVRVARLKQMIK